MELGYLYPDHQTGLLPQVPHPDVLGPIIQLKTLKRKKYARGWVRDLQDTSVPRGKRRGSFKNPNCLLKQRTQGVPLTHHGPRMHICVRCTSKGRWRLDTWSFKTVFQQLCDFPPLSKYSPFLIEVCKESESELAQLCPTLCDPMDCSLPGFSVHGVFCAGGLEWVAISSSRGSS